MSAYVITIGTIIVIYAIVVCGLNVIVGYAGQISLGHAAFFGKRMRRFDVFIVFRSLVHLLRTARRWVRGKMAGDIEQATYAAAYLCQFAPGIVAGLRSSKRPPSLSVTSMSDGQEE